MRTLLMTGLVGLLALAASGCARVTSFHTQPEGAKVYINGREAGTTPFIYHSDSGLPTKYRVQVLKEGFEQEEFFIDSQMNLPWTLCLGATTGVGMLWAWWLDDDYLFNLRPARVGAAPMPAEAPAVTPVAAEVPAAIQPVPAPAPVAEEPAPLPPELTPPPLPATP